MRSLRLGAILCASVAIVSASSASGVVLINPDGAPIGSAWQRWADDAKAPLPPHVALGVGGSAVDAECVADAGGCAHLDAETIYLGADANRQMLYHELGHLFDAELLTDAQRARFMALWRWHIHPGQTIDGAWWAGEDRASSLFGQGPPGEWFAEAYRLCATWGGWSWSDAFKVDWYQYGFPAQHAWGINGRSAKWGWTIQAQRATCRLIGAAR